MSILGLESSLDLFVEWTWWRLNEYSKLEVFFDTNSVSISQRSCSENSSLFVYHVEYRSNILRCWRLVDRTYEIFEAFESRVLVVYSLFEPPFVRFGLATLYCNNRVSKIFYSDRIWSWQFVTVFHNMTSSQERSKNTYHRQICLSKACSEAGCSSNFYSRLAVATDSDKD